MGPGRRRLLLATASVVVGGGIVGLTLWPAPAATRVLRVYRSPSCGCCGAWMAHMAGQGFSIEEHQQDDLAPVKARLGVPAALASCHTAVIDGYVIEGHVPASDVLRLLEERPAATGLAVPGMPIGSPGMEQGERRAPYAVLVFGPRGEFVFARH